MSTQGDMWRDEIRRGEVRRKPGFFLIARILSASLSNSGNNQGQSVQLLDLTAVLSSYNHRSQRNKELHTALLCTAWQNRLLRNDQKKKNTNIVWTARDKTGVSFFRLGSECENSFGRHLLPRCCLPQSCNVFPRPLASVVQLPVRNWGGCHHHASPAESPSLIVSLILAFPPSDGFPFNFRRPQHVCWRWSLRSGSGNGRWGISAVWAISSRFFSGHREPMRRKPAPQPSGADGTWARPMGSSQACCVHFHFTLNSTRVQPGLHARTHLNCHANLGLWHSVCISAVGLISPSGGLAWFGLVAACQWESDTVISHSRIKVGLKARNGNWCLCSF